MNENHPQFSAKASDYSNFSGFYELAFKVIVWETEYLYLCNEAGGEVIGGECTELVYQIEEEEVVPIVPVNKAPYFTEWDPNLIIEVTVGKEYTYVLSEIADEEFDDFTVTYSPNGLYFTS